MHELGPVPPDPVEMALRRYVRGRLLVEELPDHAISALSAGVHSPSLCVLAGLSRRQVREDPLTAWDLFRAAVAELRRTIPDFCEVLHAETRDWARKLLVGECTVREAADGIAFFALAHDAYERCPELPALLFVHDAETFAYLESTGLHREAAELGGALRRAILALLDPAQTDSGSSATSPSRPSPPTRSSSSSPPATSGLP